MKMKRRKMTVLFEDLKTLIVGTKELKKSQKQKRLSIQKVYLQEMWILMSRKRILWEL